MRTLIAFMLMVGVAWGDDIKRPCPHSWSYGDMTMGINLDPWQNCLEARIEALEKQVRELRVQVLPMSCIEYVRDVEFRDVGNVPKGLISRMTDKGYFAWHKIKPECRPKPAN